MCDEISIEELQKIKSLSEIAANYVDSLMCYCGNDMEVSGLIPGREEAIFECIVKESKEKIHTRLIVQFNGP